MRLVPFGESIPYLDLIPFFNETFIGIGIFEEGREARIFETGGYKHGVMVCFESSYGAHARMLVREGAEFLSVITNDAWYGRSAGPDQHLVLSILRAVATRRPIVRSANTGISAIIDPSGRIVASLPLMETGVVMAEIVPQRGTTFFVRWGNLWLMLAAAGVVIASVVQAFLAKPTEQTEPAPR